MSADGTAYAVPVALNGRPIRLPAPRAEQGMSPVAHRLFRRRVIVQVLLCALPVTFLLAFSRASLAGAALWALFGLLMVRLMFLGRATELLCLLIALAPLLNLLRDFAPTYQIIAFTSLLGILYYALRSHADLWNVMRKNALASVLLMFVTIYYAASFIFTGKYDINLRLFDLAFTVIIVLIVGRSRQLLGVALLGLVISGWAVGLAMLQHLDVTIGSRLGSMLVEGHILGNPVSLGTPLALCFLGLVLDRGRWFNLEHRPVLRLALAIPTFALLALTTSRAAWLVTAGGILVALVFDGRSRGRLLLLIGLAAIILQAVLLSPYGEGLQAGLDRTFSEERSATSRTSGRSDQWVVTYYALTTSASSLLYGYGPGLSPRVYAKYSKEARGVTYAVGGEAQFHSLYMQVAVEMGLLGLTLFLTWLITGLVKNFRWMTRYKRIVPFVFFLGYMIIIVTVSGNDSVSGLFLGIGLLTTFRPDRRLRPGSRREVRAPARGVTV
ncbi:MAG: O-antigen ligase family protein [Bacteroidota bacterium]